MVLEVKGFTGKSLIQVHDFGTKNNFQANY